MLIACWSPKGGSGTTVVATTLALLAARAAGTARIADLGGDVPATLGLPEPGGPGLAEWLTAGDDVDSDALARLEIDAGGGLRLLARGQGELAAGDRAARLAAALAGPDPERVTVVDAAVPHTGAELEVIAGATASLMVLRPCYLALRRAVTAPLRPSGIVLVREPGRALTRTDVEHVLGVPVTAELDVDPIVARAVDAGLLAARLPRTLARGLRHAA